MKNADRVTVIAFLAIASAGGAETGRRTPTSEVPAEKFYKNIQVLQGTPSTGIMPAMKFMADSLGVRCSYCHVTNDSGRWPVELDDKAAKGRAREMIRMTREINRANFKGRMEVTCATCHHGAVKPVPTPPLEAAAASAHGPAAVPGAAPPSVDAVIEKYVAAVGGRAAIARVRSRHTRGTLREGEESHPIEMIQTARGQFRSSVELAEGPLTTIFDGVSGWIIGPSWKNPLQPDEIDEARAHAAIFPAAGLRSRFSALAVFGPEDVSGRPAWMMRARTADGAEETFYFDAESGLLVRTIERQRTPLGDIPRQTDYADYREAEGCRVPFSIRHAWPGHADTVTVSTIRDNAPIHDSMFAPSR